MKPWARFRETWDARYREDTPTPISDDARERFEKMPPVDAVIRAWADPGIAPGWHHMARKEVRRLMPLLAESLDRLAFGEKEEIG